MPFGDFASIITKAAPVRGLLGEQFLEARARPEGCMGLAWSIIGRGEACRN
jgi:hypothetical protein